MRSRRRLLAAALVGLALAACGKKGPPVVPESRFPLPPTPQQTYIDDGAIVIRWSNPSARVDGSPLRDLSAVRLFRREDSGAGPLKPAVISRGRVVGYEPVTSFKLDPSAPGGPESAPTQWLDRKDLTLGRRYVYVLTAADSIGRSSPPSERRAITFLAPPKPPSGVEALPGNQQVTLTWHAPTEFADGAPIGAGEVGYVVLRGAGAEGPLGLITPQPITATRYTDTGLPNDTEFHYAIRAVRTDPRAVVAGPPSVTVSVSPAQTARPAPPRDLVAVPSPAATRLAWRPSPDPSVITYAIYRATGPGSFTRIATAPALNTTFIDRDVRPGAVYRYVVTALDGARTPNESPPSNEVTITTP
ncbi:MAG TPA: fibronectin type III domain-containing protein [Candidatus Methylomirabilis sp.]|nr:fibronectin type III domain-containing protein [Candidatus Methylomirabilis sp.]